MALKAILENLDELPDELKELYKEQDVKIGIKTEKRFVLQVDGVEEHPRVKNLQGAHERQKADNVSLRTENHRLKEMTEGLPDDFTPAMFEEVKAKAEGKGGDVQAQLDRQKADLEKKYEKALQPVTAERDRFKGALFNTQVEAKMTESLIKAGIDTKFIPAVRALLKDQGKIEMVINDNDISIKVSTNLGDQTVEEFVADWAASDAGKPYIAQANGTGSGGNERPSNSSGDNPFNRKDGAKPNETQMQELWVRDKAKATQLAKQAGWSDQELVRIGLT